MRIPAMWTTLRGMRRAGTEAVHVDPWAAARRSRPGHRLRAAVGIPLLLLGSFTVAAPTAPATSPEAPDHVTGSALTDHGPSLRSSTGRGYVDPTTGDPTATRVIRAFDKPEENWLPGHRGVDLALSVGSDVLAAGDGTVAFAGPVAGTPTISIDHSDGVRTTYQPVHPHLSLIHI